MRAIGASLGIECDQGPQRDQGPDWFCACFLLRASLGTTGDQGPAFTRFTCCLLLAWGAWRQLSHGTTASSHTWGSHSKAPSPPLPVVTFVRVMAGFWGVEMCCMLHSHVLALCSPGPAPVFPMLSRVCSGFPCIISPSHSPEPDFSSYEES